MGLVYADIELTSGDDLVLFRKKKIQEKEIRTLPVKILVDSGAYTLSINEHIKEQLGLEKIEERVVELADGSEMRLEVVAAVEIRFENRRAMVEPVVLPGNAEPLLGVVPMEIMDVRIEPLQEKLIVNPETPFIPKSKLKKI
ncbi:MAG: aspartyl protease family protein [Deltaproteobacteria bacterium]|nr:aspartyl protease family protein [Deltaproteobacteria bacterium]